MKTSPTDCCIRVCGILAVAWMAQGLVFAIPSQCDDKCRERQVFAIDDPVQGVICECYYYKDCYYCVGGLCAKHDSDSLPDGKCQQDTMLKQKTKGVSCSLVCALQPGSSAEAAEITSGETYDELSRGPYQCKQ